MLCAIALIALMAADPEPKIHRMAAPENVWDVTAEDFNGDGLKDLLVLNCDERSYPLKKNLSVYLSKAGAYPGAPSFNLPLDAAVGSVLLAEVFNGAPKEVLATDSSGATLFQFKGDKLVKRERVAFPSLFPSTLKQPVFQRNAAIDLDGDGIEEWLIPEPTGFKVRTHDVVKADLACDVASEIFRRDGTRIIYRLPAYNTFDMPGSPVKGLAFLSDEFADFAYGPGWKTTHRFRIPVNVKEKWEANAKMADINNDGFPDLMVTQTRGTVNMEARTQVYIASAPFTYPDKPTAEFVAKGGIASPLFVDVDGDKRQDVLVIGISLSVKNIISYFVRGRLGVNADVHVFNGTDFGKGPAFQTDLSLQAPDGREEVAYTLADFNGDGRVDLVFGESATRITVKLGQADRFVAAKPWVVLDVPGFGLAQHAQLDDRPGEELILFHPSGATPKQVEAVFFPN